MEMLDETPLNDKEKEIVDNYIDIIESMENMEYLLGVAKTKVIEILNKYDITDLRHRKRIIKVTNHTENVIHNKNKLINTLCSLNKQYLMLNNIEIDADTLAEEIKKGNIDNNDIKDTFSSFNYDVLTCNKGTYSAEIII